jgi:hypothetical protein
MVETHQAPPKQTRSVLGRGTDLERPGSRRVLPSDELIVRIVCAASALGAALVHARATGSTVSDVVVALCFGAFVAATASRAQPWAWTAAAGVAAAGSSGMWTLVAVALLAICLVDAAVVDLPHRPAIGAVIGATTVQVLLHLPDDRLRINTVVTVAAVACLANSGRAVWLPLLRNRSTRAWLIVGAIVLLAIAGVVFSAVRARHSVDVGIARAQEGLRAARAGDGDRAAQLLDDASRSFRAANGDLGGWWTKPALVLPGVGQQARALDLLSESGADLTHAAAVAARSANVQSLRVRDGRMDLDQVRHMAGPLAAVTTALDSAQGASSRAASPWLISPIASQLREFTTAIDDAAFDAQSASDAVAVLPDILGGNGQRRYFIVFATPSEARDLGGFMGAYGILTTKDGKLSLDQTGRVRDLNSASKGRQLTDPSPFPDRFRTLQPERYWQDVTGTADFPTVAEAVRQLWPQSGEGQLDGVLYLDPVTLAAMMKLTGPVTVAGYDKPLTAETAAAFLMRDQYIAFPNDDRHEFQVDAAKTVFRKLTTGTLPEPKKIADTLGPSVAERRLMLHSFHPEEQALFERLHLDGALPAVDGDFLSVRASNRGLNKIDSFSYRTVSDQVTVDPGRNTVHASVTVQVRNEAPNVGLPPIVIGNQRGLPVGTNSTTIAVSTPLRLVDVTIAGESVSRAATTEYGRSVYTALVDVYAGTETTVTFELEGTMDLSHGYRLDVVPQALVNPDDLEVRVRPAEGWRVDSGGTFSAELRESEHVTASLSR